MHAQALSILAGMAEALLEEGAQTSALQRVTDTALQLIEADHASLRLRGEGGRLESAARSGVGSSSPAPAFREGEGLLGWVAQTGRAARVGDSRGEPRFVDRSERGYRVSSVLSVPIRGASRTLGVLSLSSPDRDAFSEEDEAIATLLASSAAQALQRLELERQALTDSQTLAFNRRYLLPRLRQEMERAARYREPLSMLLLDLDHFKRVNDTYGHVVGDGVLRAFCDAVRASVRSVDVMVRRGGEEFVLLMPATDADAARAAAERVRAELASRPLAIRPGLALRQTVSIGVATWDGSEAPDALEERADAAMYAAKRRGRNRVGVAELEASCKLRPCARS